tara:strand:+ start:417 stop:575 length:159 start_codon:yes stop_codon:yes gene_type:complete
VTPSCSGGWANDQKSSLDKKAFGQISRGRSQGAIKRNNSGLIACGICYPQAF